MKVQLHHPPREMELHGPKRVRDLLGTLKIVPDTVLVIRGDELITEDEPLRDDDAIEIRPVISGGAARTLRFAFLSAVALFLAGCATTQQGASASAGPGQSGAETVDLNLCVYTTKTELFGTDYVNRQKFADAKGEPSFQSVRSVESLSETQGCDLMVELTLGSGTILPGVSNKSANVYSAYGDRQTPIKEYGHGRKPLMVAEATSADLFPGMDTTPHKLRRQVYSAFRKGTPLYARVVAERDAVRRQTEAQEQAKAEAARQQEAAKMETARRQQEAVHEAARQQEQAARAAVEREAAQKAGGGAVSKAELQALLKEALKESGPPQAPSSPAARLPIASDIDRPVFGDTQRALGEDDVAVVIGVEKYQDLPAADYAASDARLVKEYLVALGLKERNIQLLVDEKATQSSIKKTVETWLANRVKKESRVVVYYSGHGSPDPATGAAYIVPHDGDPNYLADTGYPLKNLYEKLGALPAQEVVVLLDACFSGAGGRSVLAKGARPMVVTREGGALPPKMVVLAATQGAQISTSAAEKGHGLFTYHVLKALKDGKKDIVEIYQHIQPLVEDDAKALNVQQSPSLNPEPRLAQVRFRLRN